MELTGLGGGIMLAIAAGLWLVYLVPNWLKRREYLATEKNAVRLQQTIRVLAETSEIPARLPHRGPTGPVAVGRAPQLAPRPDPMLLASRRLRRTRSLATVVLLASFSVAVAAGIGGAWLVVAAAVLAAICSFALLGRLAEVSRARHAPAARAARTATAFTDHAPLAQQRSTAAAWTPVPVPRPVYLSRSEAPAAAAANPEWELAAAAASAERRLRETARPAPAVVPVRPAAQSRFANMGIVDAAESATPDIDAALARRRVG